MEQNSSIEEMGVAVISGGLEKLQGFKTLNDFRLALQGFITKVSQLPSEDAIGATADGKAKTVYISHIETTLDEYFFGLWETENFKWQVVQNEIVGSIELVMIHPVSGLRYRRTGAAAIQIMVDKYPMEPTAEESKLWKKPEWDNYRKDKNRWALDVENKKQNALDMGFPKLKADCVKNAALSIGKLFGRDINRDKDKTDTYSPLAKEKKPIPEELRAVISETDLPGVMRLWAENLVYQSNPEFLQLLNERKAILKQQANQQ